MKTEEILLLDCRKKENKHKLNKYLWQVKPVTKLNVTKGSSLEVSDLEYIVHGLCEHYPYKIQQIWEYREDNKFKFYHVGIMRITDTNEWLGDVNGVTLWEIMAKTIIKIYGDLKERKRGKGA